MHRRLYVLDPREKWVRPVLDAARRRGWEAQEIAVAADADRPGYALIFPHANPAALRRNQAEAELLARRPDIRLVTDIDQIRLYEDKRGQARRWGAWMPRTWIFEREAEALALAGSDAFLPLISKADVGASSQNVRLLETRDAALRHVRDCFGPGVPVEHCDSAGTRSLQLGYVILQEFVPHAITYRVNAVGRQRAIFYRNCYPDRPMAQTGNVAPAYALDDEARDLLDYADRFFAAAGTQWCAVDILKSAAGWRVLETSLRWPWPSPGDCNNGRFFGVDRRPGRTWFEMWDVLIDELEAGSFG